MNPNKASTLKHVFSLCAMRFTQATQVAQDTVISIASNIADGKERKTVNEFNRFLYIAKGAAGELRTQIIIAKKIGYIDDRTSLGLLEKTGKIGGMIGNLIKTLKKGRDK